MKCPEQINLLRQNSGCWLPGTGEDVSNCLMGMEFLFCWMDNKNVLEPDRIIVVAQHCEWTKCHHTVHFKVVNSVLCEFQLNKLLLKSR